MRIVQTVFRTGRNNETIIVDGGMKTAREMQKPKAEARLPEFLRAWGDVLSITFLPSNFGGNGSCPGDPPGGQFLDATVGKTCVVEDPQPLTEGTMHLDDDSTYCIEDGNLKLEKILYPIDDLLVIPAADDPIYADRPIPSTKFSVPMECVGNLIMVWDFCSSFCKLLRLSPFSLEDFENAVLYNAGDLELIVETHRSILSVINRDVNDSGSTEGKRKALKITSDNWVNHLCIFFEKESSTDVAKHLAKLKKVQYHNLDVRIKLSILSELVSFAVTTDVVRGQLDEYIEQQQALVSTKRVQDLEESRREREEKKLKQEMHEKNSECGSFEQHDGLDRSNNMLYDEKTQDLSKKVDMSELLMNGEKPTDKNNRLEVLTSRRINMRRKQEEKISMQRERELKRSEELKKLREKRIARAQEARERKLKEKRQQHFDKEIEKLFIRTNSLGKDRDYNVYWFFRREGRIFVESGDHERWGFYSSKEELVGLMASLNPKDERELDLKAQLDRQYEKICSAMQSRSKEMAECVKADTSVLRRSVRVCMPPKKNNPLPSFLTYVNKWKKQR